MATGGRSSDTAEAHDPIRVFVCYRRTDDSNFIGRLYDRLSDKLGDENVFRDIDSIPAGTDFTVVIRETLAKVDTVVAVIGPTWHGDRLFDEDDFVRMELVESLQRGVPILPILIEDTSLPHASEIPEELRSLLNIQFARVRGDPDFRRDTNHAIEAITELGRAEQQRRQLAAEAEAEAARQRAAAEQGARLRLAAGRATADRLAREHAERTATIRRLEAEFASRLLAEEQDKLAELAESQEAAAAEVAAAADELRRLEESPVVHDSPPSGETGTAAVPAASETSAPGPSDGESVDERTELPDTSTRSDDSARQPSPASQDQVPPASPATPIVEAEAPNGPPSGHDGTADRSLTKWLRDHPAAPVAAVLIAAGSVATFFAIGRDENPADVTQPPPATEVGPASTAGTPATGTAAPPENPLAGTTVRILSTATGLLLPDAESSRNDALQAFANQNRMTISYVGVGAIEFEEQLQAQVDTGSPPDIALFTRGPTISEYATRGDLVAVPDEVTDSVTENWHPDWLKFWNVDGQQFGVPTESGLQSLMWYVPSAFAAKGYAAPETLTGFYELVAKMVDDGEKPLCVGFKSPTHTGSPFTEWIEELILRQQGIEYYRQWTAHEIPFNQPDVVAAMEQAADLWAPENVYTANGSLAETGLRDSAQALVEGKCMMIHHAARLAQLFPDGTEFGTGSGQVDAFYFPSDDDQPVMVNSIGAGAFRDAPEVWAVMDYLASPQYADARRSKQGGPSSSGEPSGFLTANRNADRTLYTTLENSFLDVLATASPAAPDATDNMPPEIGAGAGYGAGAFVTETFALANGEKEALAAAEAIEAAWPPD